MNRLGDRCLERPFEVFLALMVLFVGVIQVFALGDFPPALGDVVPRPAVMVYGGYVAAGAVWWIWSICKGLVVVERAALTALSGAYLAILLAEWALTRESGASGGLAETMIWQFGLLAASFSRVVFLTGWIRQVRELEADSE